MVQDLATRAVSLLAVLLCAGCGTAANATLHATPVAPPTPTLPAQITLAERGGPGFLRFCPLQEGRASARYDIDVPGGATVDGWCQTQAVRDSHDDRVTFTGHWDAVPVLGRSGTMVLTYEVPRTCAIPPPRCVRLLNQTGDVPP